MSLTGCLKKAGDALSTQDRAAVLDLAFRKRGEGLKADAAARAALDEMIAGIRDKLGKDAPAKAEQRPQEPEPPLVTKTGRGLPVPTVESIVKSITKWWKNAPAISVIDTMLDAPKEVFDKYQRETKAAMKAGERLGEVKGFIMPDGRVFIVADAATDARSVVRTVFHEVLGHHGLRGTFGKRIVQILDSVIDMRPADVANKAIEYGMASQYGANGEKLTANAILRGMTKEDRRAAAEEVLAELAEQYLTLKEAGLIRRLIRAIKAWIMENMPNARQFLAMSDEDLIANFIIPARNWIQKGKASRGGAVAFQRAYHGSPHKFDKFRLDKIGTGEGAQAYGYGLYFASKKEIAEHYRNKLSDTRHVARDGARLIDKRSHGGFASLIDEMRRNGRSQGDVIAYLRRQTAATHPNWKDAIRLADRIEKGTVSFKGGQLYTVDIPEDSELLDWDKPLSEQPRGVNKAIQKVERDRLISIMKQRINARAERVKSGENTDALDRQIEVLREEIDAFNLPLGGTGERYYKSLSRQFGGDRAASQYLASLGIRGIKYLDGNSRTAKDGSHNYVIFDDKDVQITDTAFSRAKTEGMATKDVVGNQSGAPADDSMGGDYKIEHRPMQDAGGAARLHDLTASFPEDIYGSNALQYYGSGDQREASVLRILRSLRGKPDATVKIYRGAPASASGINTGDWVTLNRSVAQDYADQLRDGKVFEKEVKAKDVTAWGDSLLEYGYFPNESPTPNSSAFSREAGREARAAISAPSEREGYGVAPTGGMQERAVRAEKSGSPEPAQKSKAAASEAKRTPITAQMEADALAVANKEIARQSEYDVQQELESIQQNGRGYDVERLIAENPKYWDAENEELTPEGYAELDRRNEQIARDNIGIRDARSLADLDHVHQFAQADAFESLAQDLGASVHGSRSFSTSRYFEVTRADGKTAGFRFADHLNTSSQHNAPDFNIAPGGNTFKQALDWLNESTTPDNSGVAFSRTATNPRNLAVEPTARDKIKAAFATPEKSQLSPKVGALDTPLRVALEKTKALNVWRAAFNLTEMLGGYAATRIAPNLTEHIKAGVIDRYGLDRAVIDQRRATNSAIMGGARTTMRILDKMGALTRAESAVLYRAATTADAAEVEALTKDLRPDSRDALTEIKRLMRDLGAEQVRLGNLDPDTFKRNEWSYLHRTYQKYETEQANDKAASAARALRIKGDQYKTRGLVDAVTAAQLADWLPAPWQAKLKGDKVSTDMRGEKFIRLEAREKTKPIDGEPTLGRLKDVAYWPANEPIPERFKGYTQDVSTWELRDVRDGKAMMWRDFTEAERTRMGEIDDIRYALVRTMQLAVQDVETGKYFEWLANNYGKELEQLPDGAIIKDSGVIGRPAEQQLADGKLVAIPGKIKDATQNFANAFRTFEKDKWVQVPDTKVQGTEVRKYGKLAGKYVPGPVWNDVRNIGEDQALPLGKAFDSLQSKWKVSKTALSPAVHVNNVMSNFVFMNWADVQSTQLLEAVKTVATMGKNDDAKALWESFKTHGGDSGAYAFHELQQGELESLLKSLESETLKQNNLNGLLNLSAALDLWREGEKRQAIAALGKSKTAQAPKALIDAMIKVYGSEDTIFRLAAFIKAKADGMTDEQAGKFAQDPFLDYSINAPWIQALRKTALPFIAFSYRAIPKLYDTAKNKPWKLMSLFIAMQALNMLGYSGSGGDEDKERKLLAKEKRGNIWGYGPVGVPKMIRMPWNDDHGSPVFLDIRRWIPVGDVADIEQSHGALPMPQWASIGGIPALFAEFFLNTQGFTGKKITLDTDTPTEKAIKTGDWAYKALMPNIPLPFLGVILRKLGIDLDPGQFETYAATGILNAGNGVTDPFGRELSLSQALMNAVGVKVGAYPEDAAMQQIKMESDAQKREIMSNINRYGRQLNRNGIDQETFDRRRDSNVEKLRKLSDERQGRM